MPEQREYAGRHVVVTGAGGGIGSAVAGAFAAAGAQVSALDRDAEGLSDLQAAHPTVRVVRLDLTDEAAVSDALERSVQGCGSIDVLATCAGVLRQGRITEMSREDFDTIVAVNLTAVFLAVKHAVPHMPDGGAIVHLSSVSAYAGSDGSWAYTATKGAVSSLTFGTAQELASRGLRVNAVCPGWVDAGFTHQALRTTPDPDVLHAAAREAHALGRMARPDEVAEAFLFLGSPTRASFITGSELFVDGGFMIKR